MYQLFLLKVHKQCKLLLYFVLQTGPGHCFFSNSDINKKVFTPIYQSLILIMRQFLHQKCAYLTY